MLTTAALLIERGHRSAADLLARYQDTRATVAALAAEVAGADQLDSAAAVVAPLTEAARRAREASAPAAAPVPAGLTLAQAINTTLHDVLRNRTGAIVFGEDVARKGGVYGVTRGLQRDFGAARVFDTILDEQTILGIALGAGLAGLLPIPEIQYLAYLHNALDQIRGEGATLEFFSTGQYRNPAVLRVAGYGYQRGFGGHFHNDNSVAALLDIPGIVVASPPIPTTPRPCWPAARRPRPPPEPSACSWNPLRSTTPAICTSPATAAGSAAPSAPSAAGSAPPGSTAPAPT